MAWEETKRQGKIIMTGDKPVDEIAFTIKRLVKIYEDRWDRKPLLQEILYALEVVIQSAPERCVSNPKEINEQQNLFAHS